MLGAGQLLLQVKHSFREFYLGQMVQSHEGSEEKEQVVVVVEEGGRRGSPFIKASFRDY